jgi:hypothetical protein
MCRSQVSHHLVLLVANKLHKKGLGWYKLCFGSILLMWSWLLGLGFEVGE